MSYHGRAILQVNLDMTDSMGPGRLVRDMQNPSYTYDEYFICIGLGPIISSGICKNPSYSGPSYPSSPCSMRFSRIRVVCTSHTVLYPVRKTQANSPPPPPHPHVTLPQPSLHPQRFTRPCHGMHYA